jgi:hypothetical protein
VLHLFDRGYAGGPWLGELGRAGVRFVMRWPKRYQLFDSKGVERKAWQIAASANAPGERRAGSGMGSCASCARPACWPCRCGMLAMAVPYGWWSLDEEANRGNGTTNEPIESEEAAWQVVLAYARRWQVETSFRYGKSELHMESPRMQQWEPRRKLLLIVTLVYAFLLSLLEQEHDLLRQWLLDRWCHRTGRRARQTHAPLYRLRWALSRLWQRYPPSCMRRSRQPVRPPGSGRITAWLMWFLVFLNLCPKSSG